MYLVLDYTTIRLPEVNALRCPLASKIRLGFILLAETAGFFFSGRLSEICQNVDPPRLPESEISGAGVRRATSKDAWRTSFGGGVPVDEHVVGPN